MLEPTAPGPEPSITARPRPSPDGRPSPDTTVPPMPSEVTNAHTRRHRRAVRGLRRVMMPMRKMMRRTQRHP